MKGLKFRHFILSINGLDLLSQRHTNRMKDVDILHTTLNLNPIPDHTGHSNIFSTSCNYFGKSTLNIALHLYAKKVFISTIFITPCWHSSRFSAQGTSKVGCVSSHCPPFSNPLFLSFSQVVLFFKDLYYFTPLLHHY